MNGKDGLNNEFKNSSFRAVLIYSIIEYSEVKINYGYKIFIKRKMVLLLTNLKRTSKKRMFGANMPKKWFQNESGSSNSLTLYSRKD